MRTKFSGILTLLLALVVQLSFAQQKTITGTVTDNTGLPLPGVNILVKGTASGTQTDFDGNYSISANVGQTLVFSYIGFKSIERPVTASTNSLNVQLAEDAAQLDEVVVTALGIERSSKELGYAVSTVSSEDLNTTRETNLINALQGKTTGVQITNQSGSVGGSTKVLIRGIASLGGSNNPLYVIDGVPISDSNIATGSRITGGVDFGNRAQDINPDDIESVSVLKGASAAALYGARAQNGVIIITTKRGKELTPSFSFSSSYRFDDPLRLPDFQNTYGPGDDGVFDPEVDTLGNSSAGWGPEVDGTISYTNVAGETVPFQIYDDVQEDFYETGITSVNNFSASGASESSDYRLSLSYTDQKGIVPSSRLNRTNLGLNSGKDLSDKLSSRFNVNYVRTNIRGSVAQGANDPNVLTNVINFLPRTTDVGLFRPWISPTGEQINPVDNFTNNPYWIANENRNESSIERFYGSAELTYEIASWWKVLGRAGYDTYNDKRFRSNRIGTIGREGGGFTDDDINNRQLTLDLISTINTDITDDLALTFRSGVQWNQRVFERIGNTAQDLTVPQLFSPGNADNNQPFKGFSDRRILGVYGEGVFNYKEWLALTLTARNDWSSTLPIANNQNDFFYPSVAVSWIFSDALNIEGDFFSYGKLRGAWANVGGDADPYQLDFVYTPDTNGYFGQYGTGGTFPFLGQLAFNGPGTLPTQDLKPENQENYEVGVELGFFKNRFRIDATYYENYIEDQILSLNSSASTGYGARRLNIGEVSNKGIELQVDATVLRSDDFSWNLNYNFSKNDFVVESLAPGVDRFVVASGFNSTQIIAEPGQSLGLYGGKFRRALDENGDPIDNQILVDPETGLRTEGENGRLGNILPDYTMGLTSVINWKNWSLRTTFDLREGGVIFSNTTGGLRRAGLAEETAVNGRQDFVDTEAFIQQPDGSLIPNNIEVSPQDYWQSYASASIAEGNTFDASFIKWREVSLSYNFDSDQLAKTPFTGLSIALQGRNLAILDSEVPHVDPETNIFGSASDGAGIERGSVPSTRSVGLNVNVKF